MSRAVVTVLNQCALKPGHVEEARKVYEEWSAFLKQHKTCQSVELVCCVEGQLVWLEDWVSKQALDQFVGEHMAFADFVTRFYHCSRGAPKRQAMHKVH